MATLAEKMASALSNAEMEKQAVKTAKAQAAATPLAPQPAPAAPRAVEDILAAREERRERLNRLMANQAVSDEILDAFEELARQRKELASFLATCDEGRRVGVDVDPQEVRETEVILREVENDVETLKKRFGITLSEKLIVRQKNRLIAASLAKTLAVLDPSAVKADDITSFIREAVQQGCLKEDETGPIAWEGKKFGPTGAPLEQVALSKNICVFVKDFAQTNDARKKMSRDATMERVKPFLIGTVRTTGIGKDGKEELLPSELDLVKSDPGLTRSLTGFLSGKGERTLVPVQNDEEHGGGFLGEILLERSGGKVIYTKATGGRLCDLLFFWYDKQKNESKLRKSTELSINKLDISGVKPDLLRKAMEAKLARERESAERRETAHELCDVSKLTDPLTFTDLVAGKVGTCPVNILWTVDERDVPLILHIESDGGNFSVTKTVQGIPEKVGWLKEFTKPHPLDVLTTDRRWKAVGALNQPNERDWQLQKVAKEKEAIFLTKENCDNFLGLEGVDDSYVVYADRYNGPDKPKTPQGFVFERTSRSLRVKFAVPGASTYTIADEAAGEAELPLEDLPRRVRAILCSVFMRLHSLYGKEGLEQVPEYLKPKASTNDGNSHNSSSRQEEEQKE